jgi:predicted O-linked N-acetylglucosamine transferase (SPINDLY family)
MLGHLMNATGRRREAAELLSRAIALQPNDPDHHKTLGLCLAAQGRFDEAAEAMRRAVALQPGDLGLLKRFGRLLQDAKRYAEAEGVYRRVIALTPMFFDGYIDLAVVLRDQGRVDEAKAAARRAIEFNPRSALAHYTLGGIHRCAGELDATVEALARAVALQPDYCEAINDLGSALKAMGRLDEAIACFCKVSTLGTHPMLASNLLYTLHFHPASTPRMVYEEHARWDARFARPLAIEVREHGNDPSLGRRLRVGYVSSDFRKHPVGRFLLPLVAHHDPREVEVYCFSDVTRPDEMTERFRAHAHVWRQTDTLSDEQLADVIREQEIDILMDLAMHTDGTRLFAFARKPAPVQVSYLAYPSTTGLSTMDYRFSDPYLDPPEANDEYRYTERTLRLSRTYWCYEPAEEAPQPNLLPAVSGGPFTFGSLNNFPKMTGPTIEMWSRLLETVANSRLLLHAPYGSARERTKAVFQQRGVDPARLEFVDPLPLAQYFKQYHRIDIALDPFPHNGATTTCDALWMGVPVVSLASAMGISRSGLSLLSNVGCPELVARTPDQYVRIAGQLAGDLPRLSHLRATLRERMRSSPLLNAPQFARDVEAAYRQMWQTWCESRSTGRKR